MPRNRRPLSSAQLEQRQLAPMKHGLRSPVTVQKRAAEVREELTALFAQHLPHITTADAPLVDLAVDAAVKLRLMNEYLERTSGGSLIDGRGRPRASAELYLRVQRAVLSIFDRLGIGPAARANLMGAAVVRQQLPIYRIAAEAAAKRKLVQHDEAPES